MSEEVNRKCPRSLILVPIESTYATSYLSVIVTLVLSCTVSGILQVFCAPDPTPILPYFGVFPLDQFAAVAVNLVNPKLVSRKIIFQVFQVPT